MGLKEDLLKDVDLFISENLETLNNMSIYNIKKHKTFKDMDYLFNILKKDKSEFNELQKKQENKVFNELSKLLEDYNLPVVAKMESRYSIAIFHKETIIGRLRIYTGELNIFNTSIDREYKNYDLLLTANGFFFQKPVITRADEKKPMQIYTSYDRINNSINDLYNEVKGFNEKKDKLISYREQIRNGIIKSNLVDKISFKLYKKEWIKCYDEIIKNIDLQINEVNDFIDFIKNITITDNQYTEILAIKHGVQEIFSKELNIN